MGWRAITGHSSVEVGTILWVYWNGQIVGVEALQLTGKASIDVQTSQGWTVAVAESTGPESAILIMPDGVRFQMTLRRHDEQATETSMLGHMVGNDWIVRSQIVTSHGPS